MLRAALPSTLLLVALAAGCGGSDVNGPGPDAGVSDTNANTDAFMGTVDPTRWMPHAKGLWIWYFLRLGLSPAQAAERAKQLGVGYVLVKSSQDGDFWDTRYTAAAVSEFTSRGIAVFAWPYITPTDIRGSTMAAVTAAMIPGTSGLILDVEAEWEGDFAAQAAELCQGIRAGAPGVWLAFTSFGWIEYHPTFPWSTFFRECGDAFFPQVYWSDRGIGWTFAYDQAQRMLGRSGYSGPIWMIQSNDDTPTGTAPSTEDLNAFFDHAGPFTSLWEFPSIGDRVKSTQLDQLHWKN